MIRLPLLVCFLAIQANIAIVLGARLELKQVNVLWRHGDRTPDVTETYPKDPYANLTYYPIGRGGLTNEGKMREYTLGKVLKSRYGKFLGPIYDPSVLVARTTNVDRTKMSLQLVLSALYPPHPIQDWNHELPWQPIPTVHWLTEEDMLLWPELCSQYATEYARVLNSDEVQEKIAAFSDLITSLEELTGLTITDASSLYGLYHIFDAQRSAKLTLPKWVWKYYPNGELLAGANLQYEIYSYNDYLKRINGGTLVRKISEDMVSYVNGSIEAGRKLFLYSAHELNVAALQSALGVYKPHVPAYSSAVIVELWGKGDEYFVKVFQYTGIPSEIVPQRIPGCSALCPLDQFLEILAPVTATDADLLCP